MCVSGRDFRELWAQVKVISLPLSHALHDAVPTGTDYKTLHEQASTAPKPEVVGHHSLEDHLPAWGLGGLPGSPKASSKHPNTLSTVNHRFTENATLEPA